jgi:competence protein ComEC
MVRRQPAVALVITAAALGAWVASAQLSPLAHGPIAGSGVMATDVIAGSYGPYALIEMEQGMVLANLPAGAKGWRGDVVRLEGSVVGEPGVARGRRHRGVARVREFEVIAGPSSPVMALGNAIRERVSTRLEPKRGGRALLAGFLVGDTDGVDEIDQEAMRRSGLSHFTAVSGSNVTLFLIVLFVALGPIGVGPKRRAVIGLVALPVFAAATRFEPSVLRASVMAGLGLGGRLIGLSMEPWQVLSTAVIGLLLLDPALAGNVGFQLSTAATAGVLIGGRWPVEGMGPRRAIAVTLGAQAGVAPLLLLHFGHVPLLSPFVNLLAAPLVALSTVLGAVGMIGPSVVADAGAWLAEVVLWLARTASGWPQVGWVTYLVAQVLVGVFVLTRRWRGAAAFAAAALAVVLILGQSDSAPTPGAVVLDVGQGDAILLSGGGGRYALVDGGPDPVRLIEHLRRYRIDRLELVVLSHVHADHATGLIGLVGRISIGEVWAAVEPHRTPASVELFEALQSAGIPVRQPEVGSHRLLGDLALIVEAPLRRYASPNDQSLVLSVEGPGRSMLLSGDIETVAQAELGRLHADVLKVPHQGAATSDPDWLEGVGADVAVISVGPNDYGHPAAWVIELLETSGAEVFRTDRDGDVLVPLS